MERLWWISRVCEEFHCLPDVAEQWLEDDGDQRLVDILMLRSYARAKAVYDAVNGDVSKLEQSWLMDQVIVNDFGAHREAREEQK